MPKSIKRVGGAEEGLQEDTLDEEVTEMEGLGAGTDFFNDADLGI